MKRVEDPAKHEAVVKKVYADAAKCDLRHCSQTARTEQYQRWLEDKDVGKVLEEWMSPAEIRVWLKDGPLKEFSRALGGEGEYARFLDHHPHSAANIVALALGPTWRVRDGSKKVKPLGCIAIHATGTKRLIWGPANDVKQLVWAALVASVEAPKESVLIVVFDTIEGPLTDKKKNRMEQIAQRANLNIAFVRV
jgi:hypothetical protein